MLTHPVNGESIKSISAYKNGVLIAFHKADGLFDKSYADKCNTCGTQIYTNNYYKITNIYSYCSLKCFEESKTKPITMFDKIEYWQGRAEGYGIFSHVSLDSSCKWSNGFGYAWWYNGTEVYEDEVKRLKYYIEHGQQIPGATWILYRNMRLTKKWGDNMKNVWDILIINKENDEVIARELVIDGDEKSACSKVSIKLSERLKNLVFNNLCYIAKNIGSY